MTVDEILELARTYLDDAVSPPLWSDEFLTGALNRAEEQAAARTLCLFDDETADVCQITLETGVKRYALDPRVVRVDSVYYAGQLLEQVNPVDMDRLYGASWRSLSVPTSWFAKDTRAIQLTTTPPIAMDGDVLELGVYRLPLAPVANFQDTPEVPAWMHPALVHWICAEAYLKVDSDNQRPDLALAHEEKFDRFFGPAVDSQTRVTERTTPRPVKTLTAPYSTMLTDVQQADWNRKAPAPKKGGK